MSDDPTRERLERELRWFRHQDSEFSQRIAQSRSLRDAIGGGSVRETRRAIEQLIRTYASEPDGEVMAFFYTAGYRTEGESLEQRLETYANRHFVSKRTALRRSDAGAGIVAGLLRDDFKYDRPWAYIFVVQREAALIMWVSFVVEKGTSLVQPAIRINGERYEFDEPIAENMPSDRARDRDRARYWIRLPEIPLDFKAAEDEPLAEIQFAWVPRVTPSWELAARLDTDELYARFTMEPFPLVLVRIERWEPQ